MYKYAYMVENAASHVASKISDVTNRKLEIRSPSKVGARVGKFWDLGIAGGIRSYATAISNSAIEVSGTVIDSMRNALETAYEYINSNEDYNPTITPVLDLSNIQNGANELNGMFGLNRTVGLASINNATFEANRLAARSQIASTNADVVAALGLLRGDVNNLNDSFLGTQVVLDSGALVGATARQMDNALGRIKVYKGRGI